MKYHIDSVDKTPAYIQLYRQLKKDITGGIYKCGAKLPSKRLLAAETGISVIPAEHAYALLCDEGYIESRQRSGYFVIYKESDFITPHSTSPEHTPTPKRIRPAITLKNEFPYTVLSKAMRKVMLDFGERLLIKSPNRGCAELREAISSYLARSNGISACPEQITVGSGAEYLYSLIVQLLGTDRCFALEDPSYEKIYRVYRANGVKCDMLKLGNDGIISSELERTEASVLHVTPFNSYPSGITASASKRQEYLRWAEKRGGYIIEDNYDSELTVSKKNEDTVFSTSEHGHVIYLNTFSGTVAPSIRVGYMILPEELLGQFEQRLGFYSCTVPVFEQYLLAELIQSGDFERHINRVRRKKRKLGL